MAEAIAAPLILVAADENVRHKEREVAESYLPNMLRFALSSGDYAWDGVDDSDRAILCGLERKKTRDLVRCVVQSNHHLAQLRRMAEDYHVRYFVWEGDAKPDPETGLLLVPEWNPAARRREWIPCEPQVQYSRIDKHLETLRAVLGVIPWRTFSYAETCRVIRDRAEWWQKPPERHTSADGFPRPFEPGGNLELIGVPAGQRKRIGLVPRLAKELEGIGWERAGEIGQRFPLPHDLDTASVAEWLGVVGLGRGTVTRVLRQWHGEERAAEMLAQYDEARKARSKGKKGEQNKE